MQVWLTRSQHQNGTRVVHRQHLSPAEDELIREPLLLWKGSVRTGRRTSLEVGGGRGRSETEQFLRQSSGTWQQQRTQWLRQIWPFCVFVFLQFYHELGWAELGWAGLGWGSVKVRGVLMRAGFWDLSLPVLLILMLISLSRRRQPPSAAQAALLLCSTLFWSEEPRPGPALRQTSTCVCMVRGM